MFQTLKVYYNQVLRMFTYVTDRFAPAYGESIKLSPRSESGVAKSTIDLSYKNIDKAFLITECNEKGVEMPLAIAFVRSGEEMIIAYLDELAELE